MAITENNTSTKPPTFGVTFSPRFAKELGLDPYPIYQKSLEDLNIKHIRMPIYWDEFEPIEGVFTENYLEPYLNLASVHNAHVIVVVGFKQPRWPECFPPTWTLGLSKAQMQDKLLTLIEKEVQQYKSHPSVSAWQVENEPFLDFGYCPANFPLDYQFVKKEIDLVKSLDNRPVLVTDSGEISTWYNAFKLTDLFGTTLYRQTWNPYIGFFTYPIPPIYYPTKEFILKKITGNQDAKTIISELQTEPWIPGQKSFWDWDVREQLHSYPPQKISQNLDYAVSTNFDTIYLWGVEWWYFMNKNGHPEYLDEVNSKLNP